LVEHQFPKLKAAGSNPVFRSLFVLMNYFLKVTILFIGLYFTKNITYSQENDISKKYNISSFLKINEIKDIAISNTLTHKKWVINKTSLSLVKRVLNHSYVSKTLPLKPGHLYIKFIGLDYSNYDTYMYKDAICFDPFYNRKTLAHIKNTHPFTIMLSQEIDWDKLK
jgi:hypothetical protein